MTDMFDRASIVEEQAREDALKRQARRAGIDGKTVADSAKECVECGEAIAQKRRLAILGCQLCVECQTDVERSQKKWRK